VEAEVLIAGYVQADFEVHFERKARKWWIYAWEEVHIGQLRDGRGLR
jgi:hypothetical protein